MRIVICGISGFVGNALNSFFQKRGDDVVALRVRENTSIDTIASQLDGSDVVINLAGASIMGRWTSKYKKILRQSRLDTTQKITTALSSCKSPPQVLLNASAVGIYDSYHQHDEYSHYFGDDFLSSLVQEWEQCAFKAQSEMTRVCIMRFGVIYGKGGGAMSKILPPFQMGFGGKMGDGFQMISWIHLDDLVRAFAFLIDHEEIGGIVNMTAPEPISNLSQTKILGKVLGRPTFLDLPSWIVTLVFGEGASVMLDSKEVYPRVLQEKGFVFKYSTFDSAMEQIVHDRD